MERDNTSTVDVPHQVPILRPPESVAQNLGFPPGGVLLRDDVFVAIDTIVTLWDGKKRQTSKPGMLAPLLNVVQDTSKPVPSTIRQGVIATGQPGIGR